MEIFVKFLLLTSFCNSRVASRPSKAAISLSDYNYYLKRMYYPELERLKAKFGELDEEVINYKQYLKENRQHTIIDISPDKMDDETLTLTRGYVFQVEFKSGTLEVVLFRSGGQCYLRITGPDGFQFGHKWRDTMVTNKWGQWDFACTKESKMDLMKILEKIDGVEFKAFMYDGPTKEQWLNNSGLEMKIDGKYVDIRDNCLPDLNYILAIDKEFNPNIFNGSGIEFTEWEMNKIDNAKKGFFDYCDFVC